MEQGKITHWGLSEASEEIIRRAHKVCPVIAIQNRYSLMYRDYEKLFPVLEELKIGFVAFFSSAITFIQDINSLFSFNPSSVNCGIALR